MRAKWIGLSLGVLAVATTTAVTVAFLSGGEGACAATLRGAPVAGVGYTGQATFYDSAGKGGNCSYPASPADQLYVALSPGEYAAAGACGGYLDVTGPKGSVRVKVMDQCPECKAGHIDLSQQAFARIGTPSAGIIKVSYRLVRNPPVPGGLTYRVKEGSSQYWLALLPDNHGNPVSRLEVRSSSGAWVALQHADYNYWIAERGAGPDRSASGSPMSPGRSGCRPGSRSALRSPNAWAAPRRPPSRQRRPDARRAPLRPRPPPRHPAGAPPPAPPSRPPRQPPPPR